MYTGVVGVTVARKPRPVEPLTALSTRMDNTGPVVVYAASRGIYTYLHPSKDDEKPADPSDRKGKE